MGRKIFISYKYADDSVAPLSDNLWCRKTTVRDYVDKLETYFDLTTHIYKGESDGEDLSWLSDDAIWEKLKDRIYDSSVTIVMISPNMKEQNRSERSQWIPWEVSFSLRETTRSDRTSHTNAILAIVLPDSNESYDYYLSQAICGSTIHHTDRLFKIIRDNKFNIKYPDKRLCPQCSNYHFYGRTSYIEAVKWGDFIISPDYYIDLAIKRQENIFNYNIHKEV